MSLDWFNDVLEFNKKLRPDRKFVIDPKLIDSDEACLTHRLVAEEYDELMEAWSEQDLTAMTDAAADLIVVVLGMMAFYGVDMRPVWEAIHAANMNKCRPCPICNGEKVRTGVLTDGTIKTVECRACKGQGIVIVYNDEGKIMKPEGWKHPDIGAILKAQNEAFKNGETKTDI